MEKKHVLLSINSTFYDMIGEYYLFITEVFPELKRICQKHNIELEYKDVAFSVHDEVYTRDLIFRDFQYVDEDRTFFICFRGQKLGWIPTANDVTKLTLDVYPELVKHVNGISLTELVIMHALRPFDKYVDGKKHEVPTAKHSLFYFRNAGYVDELNEQQSSCYINKSDVKDKEVQDFEIARAKDLIYDFKREFVKIPYDAPRVLITHYDGEWNNDLDLHEMLEAYIKEYIDLNGQLDEDFLEVHKKFICKYAKGCLNDFTYEGRPLKDVMIEDILGELKLEFPENFS
jgi:hypothetical protein